MQTICIELGARKTVIDAELWELPLTCNFRSGESRVIRPCDVKWSAVVNRNHVYAGACKGRLWLHRIVTQCPAMLHVDHIDGDGLNNVLANLRCVTPAENSRREFVIRGGASRFRGVRRCGKRKPWNAQIHFTKDGRKRCKSLGTYATEQEAADAYDAAAIEIFGPLAVTNAKLFAAVAS